MARSKRAVRAAPVKELVQLRPGAPLVGDAMPPTAGRYRQRTIDRAIDADLARLNGIYAEAALGRTNQLIDLCKSTYRYDSRLAAVIQTRVRALQSREWIVKPPPGYADDPEAKSVAERVTTILNETQGLKKILGQLGYGAIEGFAVAEHAWRLNSRGEWVSQPEWRHSNRFAWNVDTLELCRCEPGQDSPPGVQLSTWPGKFLVHSPSAGAADYPWQRGAVRSRLTPSVIKRFGVRWWLKMLERWGQPQVFATLPANLRTGAESEVDDALRALGSAWFARFPEGTSIETISAQVNDALHKNFVDWQNTEDAIAILGQNLTTEVTAGSFAAAKAHQLVRLDVLAADLAELAETITDQWIRWLVYYNWPGSPVPYIDFVLAPQGEITVQHYQAGLFTADEVRNAMGYDAEPEGKGARFFVPPPTFGAPPAAMASASPPGGAAPALPFTSRGPMKSPSTHPLVNSLSRR